MKKKLISIMLILTLGMSFVGCATVDKSDEVQLTEHEKQTDKTKDKKDSSIQLEPKSDYKNYIKDIDKLDINGVEASITMSLVKKDKKATDTRLDKFNSLTESYDNIKPEDINIKLAQTFKGNSGTDGLKI